MSKIKTLTLLSSPMACGGSWSPCLRGCAQGPCRVARHATTVLGRACCRPVSMPPGLPGDPRRGNRLTVAHLVQPPRSPSGRALPRATPSLTLPLREKPGHEATRGTGHNRAGHGGDGSASSHRTSARQGAQWLLPDPRFPHLQVAEGAARLCQGL